MSFEERERSEENAAPLEGGGLSLSSSGRLVSASDFQAIPNEIALLIFAYLNMKDLLSISQTCRHWNTISEDDFLWKPLYKARWGITTIPTRRPLLLRPSSSSSTSSSSSSLSTRRQRAKAAESDHDQSAVWRSWKNRYVTRRNWLAGRVLWQSTVAVHARTEGEALRCVAFDHEKLVAGSTDGAVYVRAVEDGRPVQTLRGHSQTVTCLQLGEKKHVNVNANAGGDGLLVTGSKDNTVRLWHGPRGAQECVATLVGHRGPISCLQFVDHRLMTRSWDLTGRVWDMNTGQVIHTVTGNSVVYAMQIEGNRLVCGYADRYVRLYDLRTGRCQRHLYGHTKAVSAVQFNDTVIASGSYDRTLRLWDMRQLETLGKYKLHTERINALQLEGQRVVTASADQTVKVWNTKTKHFRFDLKGPQSGVNDVQFDEKKVICVDDEGSLHMWNFSEIPTAV